MNKTSLLALALTLVPAFAGAAAVRTAPPARFSGPAIARALSTSGMPHRPSELRFDDLGAHQAALKANDALLVDFVNALRQGTVDMRSYGAGDLLAIVTALESRANEPLDAPSRGHYAHWGPQNQLTRRSVAIQRELAQRLGRKSLDLWLEKKMDVFNREESSKRMEYFGNHHSGPWRWIQPDMIPFAREVGIELPEPSPRVCLIDVQDILKVDQALAMKPFAPEAPMPDDAETAAMHAQVDSLLALHSQRKMMRTWDVKTREDYTQHLPVARASANKASLRKVGELEGGPEALRVLAVQGAPEVATPARNRYMKLLPAGLKAGAERKAIRKERASYLAAAPLPLTQGQVTARDAGEALRILAGFVSAIVLFGFLAYVFLSELFGGLELLGRFVGPY